MTAFKGQALSADSLEAVKAEARVPILFDRAAGKGVMYTHRGVDVVYILEFANGTVKVGQSVDFETRVRANCSNRRVRGHKLMRFWRVGSDAPLADEATLIRLAGELGGTADGRTREWFTGVEGMTLINAAERELATLEREAS
ncbi:hypothetical protein EV379_1204 [Microterricola gilva]|uniref:GIY-YIG nuclease family protein n=1 Tax=Microterricola gilva TaxID=393267 RepID=A0A4Q8ALR0_9MICO|nr:hypothetical protein [Microterricola gilva]RZU64893.1 hypothetical protein EV379_1204 [Microterricola gilva]